MQRDRDPFSDIYALRDAAQAETDTPQRMAEQYRQLKEAEERVAWEVMERDAWTRFAVGAMSCIPDTLTAAKDAEEMLDRWRARWGRKEGA